MAYNALPKHSIFIKLTQNLNQAQLENMHCRIATAIFHSR